MVEAKEDVNKMKAELAIKNQELAAASKEAEALLKSISESTAIAEKGERAAVWLQRCSANQQPNACSPPGMGTSAQMC